MMTTTTTAVPTMTAAAAEMSFHRQPLPPRPTTMTGQLVGAVLVVQPFTRARIHSGSHFRLRIVVQPSPKTVYQVGALRQWRLAPSSHDAGDDHDCVACSASCARSLLSCWRARSRAPTSSWT